MSHMKLKANKTILIDNRLNEFKYSQYDYLTDEKERLIPEFVVRYEHYDEDIQKLMGCLGRTAQIAHENDSGNVNTSMRQDENFLSLSHMTVYDIYTNETKMLVEEFYKDDFMFFGYTFLQPQPIPIPIPID